jgi:hypothetical protein
LLLQLQQWLLLVIMQHQYNMVYLPHLHPFIMDKKVENRPREFSFSSSVHICLLFLFCFLWLHLKKYIIYCDEWLNIFSLTFVEKKTSSSGSSFARLNSYHMTSNECVSMRGRKTRTTKANRKTNCV